MPGARRRQTTRTGGGWAGYEEAAITKRLPSSLSDRCRGGCSMDHADVASYGELDSVHRLRITWLCTLCTHSLTGSFRQLRLYSCSSVPGNLRSNSRLKASSHKRSATQSSVAYPPPPHPPTPPRPLIYISSVSIVSVFCFIESLTRISFVSRAKFKQAFEDFNCMNHPFLRLTQIAAEHILDTTIYGDAPAGLQ